MDGADIGVLPGHRRLIQTFGYKAGPLDQRPHLVIARRSQPLLPLRFVGGEFARESVVTETERDELERSAMKDISRVLGGSFAPPQLTVRPTMTIIDWLHSDVAIELELDWREQEIFCLLVRLEHGKLPEGYYIANGNPCRYHLQKVIREHAWNANLDAFAVFSKRSRRRRRKDLAYMRDLLSAYEIVLTSCVERIRTVGHTVFEKV